MKGFLTALALLLPTPALADALVDNVDGITLDADGKVVRFTGIVVAPDGKVVRLLSAKDKRPERPDWRADMKGRVLIPGFVDAHGHVLELGFRQVELDLSETKTLDEAKARIAAYAAANPERKWIIGGGWNQEVWGLGRFPTAADLDGAVADRPVLLARADPRLLPARLAAIVAGDVGEPASVSPDAEKVGHHAASGPASSRRRTVILFASLAPAVVALLGSFSLPPRLLNRLPRGAMGRRRTTVDFVFAYYDEPLDHFNGMIEEMLSVPGMADKQTRVIVYTKGDLPPVELAKRLRRADEIHRMKNIGREGGTYLHHIIRNYDIARRSPPPSDAFLPGDEAQYPLGLADHTSFAQGHLAWIGVGNERLRIFNDSTGYLHYAPYVSNSASSHAKQS